jgi:small-conductance mechanosensitive channel
MDQASHFVQPAISVVVAAALAWLVTFVVQRAVRRIQTRSPSVVWSSLQRRCRWPFRSALGTAALLMSLPYTGLNDEVTQIARQILVIALIAAVTWLVAQLILVAEDVALARINVDVADNRRPRRMRTQILVLGKVIIAIIVFVGVAAAVMSIPGARTFGASFLVSAGVFSVVAGVAAQATLSNFLAGVQIALTDPIRIDDVVVVHNDEWGRIEEITLTYVVVRTWDNRRLILPISWFTTNVFQNWTRHESRVIGSIILHVDFTVPVGELRDEMYRLVQESPLWDRQDWVLQVVDTTPSTMVLRGLVSSADAPTNWDLRCDLREGLLTYLREHHPDTLPKVRASVSSSDSQPPSGPGESDSDPGPSGMT